MTTQEIEKMLEVAGQWVGYLEKSMCQYLWYEQKRTGCGKGNFSRFGRIADLVIFGKDRRVKDGYAWCCMFVLSCLYESKAGHVDTTVPAGTIKPNTEAINWIKEEIANGQPLTYHAGCAAWNRIYRQYGGVSNVPTRGAFVLYLHADGKPYHIGIVERNNNNGTFTSIEGNTNWHGSEVDPNGGAVARKTRRNKGCIFLTRHLLKHA